MSARDPPFWRSADSRASGAEERLQTCEGKGWVRTGYWLFANRSTRQAENGVCGTTGRLERTRFCGWTGCQTFARGSVGLLRQTRTARHIQPAASYITPRPLRAIGVLWVLAADLGEEVVRVRGAGASAVLRPLVLLELELRRGREGREGGRTTRSAGACVVCYRGRECERGESGESGTAISISTEPAPGGPARRRALRSTGRGASATRPTRAEGCRPTSRTRPPAATARGQTDARGGSSRRRSQSRG